MKKTVKLGLSVILICGLMFSTTAAQEIQEIQEATQEKESSEIKELTIRNSGFRSRSTIVIKYTDKNKQIVSVTENGKELPPSEFPRYESVMRTVLELPQIDTLLPEIDRMWRKAESARFSEETKLQEITALRQRLSGLESDVARRYQEMTELQLIENLNLLTEKISESKDLSQKEKIEQLEDVIKRMQALNLEKNMEPLRRGLLASRAAIAERKLIEEINKSTDLSKQEKIKEIRSIIQRMQKEDLETERRRIDLVELEARQAIGRMLAEITKDKVLSDIEKEKEFYNLIQEVEKINSESFENMLGLEKFEFELYQLLKRRGFFPIEKAEFVLKSSSCTIAGKKLPKEMHQEILQLCEESIGRKFNAKTKIVLQLNEDS
ncbi:hypothetical protein ACFLRW_04395 [Acidobacteriota bacterium]